MKGWKVAAMTAVIVTAAGIGAAMAPVAQGQSRSGDFGEMDRLVQVVTGGSQIGVSIRDVSEEDVTRAKLPTPSGVLIEEVREGSPAEKAGLRSDDVVVEFDGERVRSARQFSRLVQETPADRQVPAVVLRDGERVTVTVQPRATDLLGYVRDRTGARVIPAPAPPSLPRAPAPPVDLFPRVEQFFGSGAGRLGLRADTLSEQLAEYFGTKSGVLVTSVAEGSAAAAAGVRAGDVITAINGNPVASLSDLSRRVQRLDAGEEFTMAVVRDRKELTLKGKVEQRQPRRWTLRSAL